MSERVAQLWDTIAEQRPASPPMSGWLQSPLLQRLYVLPQICDPWNENWAVCQVERLGIPRNGHWLSIACGSGTLECVVAEEGVCASLEGVDIAPKAIARAQKEAAERGLTNLHFRVADLEYSRLPANRYDVVLCGMGLHHIRRLEFFLEEVVQSLRPGGWILLNEFIGPSQWQWTDTQLMASNILLAAIPERYRSDARNGAVRQSVTRPTIEYMTQTDPSESIRSAEIMPLLREYFHIVEQRDYGGAILHLLLEHIMHHFTADDPESVNLLRLLCATEQVLMKTGALPSDFTVVAARNDRTGRRSSSLPFTSAIEWHTVYGVYPVETLPDGGIFCWTEPEAAFALERPPWAHGVRLRAVLPPVDCYLTIQSENQPVGTVRCQACPGPGSWHTLTFGLPPTQMRQPTISLHLDRSWSPAEVLGSHDQRALGVALAELTYI